jgi:23S rRNA (guanosine2251-2'-O)-methyltransferase
VTEGPDGRGRRPEHVITVYGKKPVLEAVEQEDLTVERVFLAARRDPIVGRIEAIAAQRGIEIARIALDRLHRITKSPTQDQGVAADVRAPSLRSIDDLVAELRRRDRRDKRVALLALDKVTTPANVGLVLRTATVLGLDGVVLPERGSPPIGPRVVKASAGVAFRASILRSPSIEDALLALKGAGFRIYGLAGGQGASLAEIAPAARSVFVLGNETAGLGESAGYVDEWIDIPMAAGGDSLNVACAATALAWEIVRERAKVDAR